MGSQSSMGVDVMARTAVVAMRCADEHVYVPAIADAVRALLAADRGVVLVSPGEVAGAAALAIGTTRHGRRAVSVTAHTLVDPADPAFAHPEGALDPAPLAILEAEAIAALVGSGFPVVVCGHVPVVPSGDAYQPVSAVLDNAAAAQRLAGDLGALTLIFVVPDDDLRLADSQAAGEINVDEAELLAADSTLGPELRAAVRFLRAGGELAVITTPSEAAASLDAAGDDSRTLRIHRELARPRSDAPVLASWS
jgi:carbamate kinase